MRGKGKSGSNHVNSPVELQIAWCTERIESSKKGLSFYEDALWATDEKGILWQQGSFEGGSEKTNPFLPPGRRSDGRGLGERKRDRAGGGGGGSNWGSLR